jgi:hypothetical protein
MKQGLAKYFEAFLALAGVRVKRNALSSQKRNIRGAILVAGAFLVASPSLAAVKQSGTEAKPLHAKIKGRPVAPDKSDPSAFLQNLTPAQEARLTEILLKIKALMDKKANSPQIILSGMYDAFNFNSTKDSLFNKYNGHTSAESLGGDNFNFYGFYTGLSIGAIQTQLSGSSQLSLTQNQNNSTNINTALLNVHARRMLSNKLSVDVFGGYGNSSLSNFSTLNNPTTTTPSTSGGGSLTGTNEYIGARATYLIPYKKFTLMADIGYAYNNFFQTGYNINYDNGTSVPVAALTTRIGLLTENARLYYNLKQNIQPFVTAGLIQVVNRFYSNPQINISTSSALPQLTLGNNGFLVGAGFNYVYKQLRLTPYYQYSQRGAAYSDNLGALRIAFLCL